MKKKLLVLPLLLLLGTSFVSATFFDFLESNSGKTYNNWTVGTGNVTIVINGSNGNITANGSICDKNGCIGSGSGNPFNQSLNTMDSPSFMDLTVNDTVIVGSGSRTVFTGGIFQVVSNITGNILTNLFNFAPHFYGSGNIIILRGSPNIYTDAVANLFYFDPKFFNGVDKKATILVFNPQAHVPNVDDDYSLFTPFVNKQYFAFSADSSNVQFDWLDLGGSVSLGDVGVDNVDFREHSYKARGGASRPFGSSGSIDQVGFTCTGFGTKSGLLSSDKVLCFESDGGELRYSSTTLNMTGGSIYVDGSQGYTGTCGSGTTLTVKDGIITGCS